VAKMVLNDFLRGKIPWFTPPPIIEGAEEKGVEGRQGRLGEMGKKRKRDDESVADTSVADLASTTQDEAEVADDEEFAGFESDGGIELDDIAGIVDDAFGLDSDDEDSEVGSEDGEEDSAEDETDGAAEEQLQEELDDDVEASKQEDRRLTKKKRQKT
jgi:nuclear GTP-binding protein